MLSATWKCHRIPYNDFCSLLCETKGVPRFHHLTSSFELPGVTISVAMLSPMNAMSSALLIGVNGLVSLLVHAVEWHTDLSAVECHHRALEVEISESTVVDQ